MISIKSESLGTSLKSQSLRGGGHIQDFYSRTLCDYAC